MTTFSQLYDFITRRTRNYKLVFGDGDRGPQRAVLKDLARFCRASETCFNEDPRVHAVLEGRREVWLRIANHLNLSPQELLAIYSPGTPFERIDEDDN
jgi:hypothetical protein